MMIGKGRFLYALTFRFGAKGPTDENWSIWIQVLRAVKTKQVTHAILGHLTEYVKTLENGGLLEAKETLQLHDAVQV